MRFKSMLIIVMTVPFILLYSVAATESPQSQEQIAQGKKAYMSYCASCHGVDGSGNGPVASSLKQLPPDLRRIQARTGKFSADEIRNQIAGESLPVHGKRDMPVWGMVLSGNDISRLVAYIRFIQRPFDPTPAG